LCARCDVIRRFNDDLYDIIIAADERSLDDPKTLSADASTSKHKLVLSLLTYYYYYEVRTHSTHTDRKTDEQTDRE